MRKVCRIVIWAFGIAYLLALALLAVGTFGLFGQEQDPLSGVFLLPLGLPWNLMLDGVSAPLMPWVAILAPAANLLLLSLICRMFSRR